MQTFLVVLVFALALFARAEEEAAEVPSPLLEAVVNDDVLAIREALRNGANIDTTNVNGWSAAMFAVTSGHIRSLHTLIDAGIDLNQANADFKTPLMQAAGQGDKEIVELLLNNNADPAHEVNGVSAYNLAMEAGRPLVAHLIAEACVIRGIYNDDPDLISISIKRGAYINIPTPAGWTALIFASSQGNLMLAKELLAKRADPNRAENDGWTPLHFAAHNGHKDIVDLLLNNGANANYYSRDNRVPKDLAREAGFLDIVEMIPDADQDL
jgi:ankyrin